VLYLGEINDTQHESWCRTIEVFDEKLEWTMPLALFPADRQLPNFAADFGVQVRLKEMELHRPRQWGACWLACELYEQLGLDEFWAGCLPDSREVPMPIYYLVGTPKGRLSKLEAELLQRPWQSVRPGVEVEVLPQENELYVFEQLKLTLADQPPPRISSRRKHLEQN
jgi:hypothetical protein